MARKRHRSRGVRQFERRRRQAAAKPGQLTPLPDSRPTQIQVIAFDADELVERQVTDLQEIPQLLQRFPVTWINVDGLANAAVVQQIGELFKLHALALEDVLHTHQRAKVEDYGDYLFIVTRMMIAHNDAIGPEGANAADGLASEQLSMFLGTNFVITFQEDVPGDCLEAVRGRLRTKQGRARGLGPDYLAYMLLDAVIDAFFPVLEQFGERLDVFDDQISAHENNATFHDFHELRGELLLLRRIIWPHREAMNALARDAGHLIKDETRVHFRDCYDHTIQLIDILETDRDLCADLRDYYLTMVSNRLNEIMKVLTIIATIFIPLSFITGLYGMNFDPDFSPWNMPELRWYYGYPMALSVMIAVAGGLLYHFYRRGWLSR